VSEGEALVSANVRFPLPAEGAVAEPRGSSVSLGGATRG